MPLPCDMTSLQHPAALSSLIGRDVDATESRDPSGADLGPPATMVAPPGSSACGGPAATGAAAGVRSAWRCDVCGYSTTVARNLRIHMTSEKHAHNVAALQRQQQQQQSHHQQHQMRLQRQLNAAAAAAAAVAASAALPPAGGYHHPSLPWSTAAAPPPVGPFLSLAPPPPTPVDLTRPSPQRSNPRAAAGAPRHQHGGQTSSSSPPYTCNLCPYRTTLRANFHLHCQTDKHAQRVQQFALSVASGGVGPANNVDEVVVERSSSQRCSDDNEDVKPGSNVVLKIFYSP